MSLLSRLFGPRAGSGSRAAAEPVSHKGYDIFPEPVAEQGGYRIAARIEKDVNGERKHCRMIRADTYSSADTATDAAVSKARQFIDQVGERIFDD